MTPDQVAHNYLHGLRHASYAEIAEQQKRLQLETFCMMLQADVRERLAVQLSTIRVLMRGGR